MALNLVQHRAAVSIWDRDSGGTAEWDTERWLLATAAGLLLAAGLRRRSAAGLMLALGGTALAWWAAGGVDERRTQRGRIQAALPRREDIDVINEAAEESFPASDPPAFTFSTRT